MYQATDTNLKRQVAIKVLPAALAGDTDRLARFQREAEVLAALNHPNIAQIFGLEKTPDVTALVMELVEGDDLSERIGAAHRLSPTESGRNEIYVRPFVPPSPRASADRFAVTQRASPDKPSLAGPAAAEGQWQISTAGGIMPAWRHDGKELYYLNPEGVMMAVTIAFTGATLEPGGPVALFPTRLDGADTVPAWQYDVAPDGRFLVNMALDSATAPITLIQNWHPDVKK